MASAIFFLDQNGSPLLSRNFRGDVPMSCVQDFPKQREEFDEPVFQHHGIHYMYIQHSNIYILAVSKTNSNAVAILFFLQQFVKALQAFVDQVEEESVRDNYIVVYELLDDMMDFGHVQTTDINLLQDYVTQTSYKLEVSQAVNTLTDKISWRPPGIYYRKNELFVDVIETVSCTLDAQGNSTAYAVDGKIAVKSFLSGMPQLKIGINDRTTSETAQRKDVSKFRASRYVDFEDIKLHQCVDLEKFERERSIEFIPPDGDFDLFTYRVSLDGGKRKPLWLFDSDMTIKGRSRVVLSCKARSQYKKRQSCSYTEFIIPVPPDCDSPRFKSSHGGVVYAPEQQAIIWRLKHFGGGRDASMQAELLLPATGDAPKKPAAPIQIKFEVPGTTASGLEIRYLKVEEETLKYHSYPWVRYLTKSGQYEVRKKWTAKPEGPKGEK